MDKRVKTLSLWSPDAAASAPTPARRSRSRTYRGICYLSVDPSATLTAKICCDAQHAPLPSVRALAAPEPRQDGKLMRQREFIALFGSTALAEPRVHAGFRR